MDAGDDDVCVPFGDWAATVRVLCVCDRLRTGDAFGACRRSGGNPLSPPSGSIMNLVRFVRRAVIRPFFRNGECVPKTSSVLRHGSMLSTHACAAGFRCGVRQLELHRPRGKLPRWQFPQVSPLWVSSALETNWRFADRRPRCHEVQRRLRNLPLMVSPNRPIVPNMNVAGSGTGDTFTTMLLPTNCSELV